MRPTKEEATEILHSALEKSLTVLSGGKIHLSNYEVNVLDLYFSEIDTIPHLDYQFFRGRRVIVSEEQEQMTLTKDQAIKRISDIIDNLSCDHLKGPTRISSALRRDGAINELRAIFDISDEEL